MPPEKIPSNTFEISIVQLLVDALVEGGIPMNDIGVISPYAAQVMLLANKLDYLKYASGFALM